MTETEIAVELRDHDLQIKSLKHRMDQAEERGKVLQDLAMSTQRLALGMEQMNAKQDNMNERLEKIEEKPAQNWNTMTRTIFTTIVGALAGGLAVWMIQGISMVH